MSDQGIRDGYRSILQSGAAGVAAALGEDQVAALLEILEDAQRSFGEELEIAHLPDAFDGYRSICQLTRDNIVKRLGEPDPDKPPAGYRRWCKQCFAVLGKNSETVVHIERKRRVDAPFMARGYYLSFCTWCDSFRRQGKSRKAGSKLRPNERWCKSCVKSYENRKGSRNVEVEA